MITGNELRIGNYVNTPRENQNPFRIDGFEFLFKDYAKVEMQIIPNTHPLTWELKDLSPIPLTAGIFESVGFAKSTDGEDGRQWDEFLKQGDHYSILLKHDNECSYYLHGDFGYCQVKYLHHLQNLIHALTGSELTIELTQVERSVATDGR